MRGTKTDGPETQSPTNLYTFVKDEKGQVIHLLLLWKGRK